MVASDVVSRVLFCGSRLWPYPHTVRTVCDRLHRTHGDRLVIIEGKCRGADLHAHRWAEDHGLPPERHRCHPVDWQGERRRLGARFRSAGPDRNTGMLAERPGLTLAFHEWFDPESGGTSDMVLKSLLVGVPAFLVVGENPSAGRFVELAEFPRWRVLRAGQEIDMLDPLLRGE